MTTLDQSHRFDAAERVAKGAALIDAHLGERAWRGQMNLDELDVSDCQMCVLGQLFSLYTIGRDRLGLCDRLAAAAHGFDYTDSIDTADEYAALAQAWRDLLRA
jgi:cytochrome c2